MTIAIDTFNIALPHGTGVATYGRNLARAAAELGHDVDLLFGTNSGRSRTKLLNEIGLLDAPSPSRLSNMGLTGATILGAARPRRAHKIPLSGQVILPSTLALPNAHYWNVRGLYRTANALFHTTRAFTKVRLDGADLVHWTYPLPIRAHGACNIYTLHDLVPLKLPYTTADHKRAYYALCKRIVKRADHILTVSECSRRDIIEMLGADPKRVTNLYQSSDIARRLDGLTDDDIARAVEGLLPVGIRDYFLFFGAIEPKKNLGRIIEGYLSSGSTNPLVIVGAPGWGSDRDVKLLRSLKALHKKTLRGRKKRILWLDYLPRNMLALLIAGARAVLFPSLYEGFGLPVLEALSVGTPVITGNISSLPEVAGEAALLVDPYDVRQIASAIRTLDADEGLRASLAQQGREQAAQFDAATYQQRLGSFYREIGL